MYNRTAINDFVNFIQGKNGISDKSALIDDVQKKYNLTKKRSKFAPINQEIEDNEPTRDDQEDGCGSRGRHDSGTASGRSGPK